MHFRLFVTMNKENAETSEEARNYVTRELENNGFINQEGRFNSGWADWFVVGGRWSGELQGLNNKFHEVVKKTKDIETTPYGITSDVIKKKAKELQKLWVLIGGKNDNIYARNSYDHEGAEDDAMIVDKRLYNKFLKEHEGLIMIV